MMYSFENIKGNERIIKSLKTAALAQKPSHAYIIDGSEGMGKHLIAKAFAKALQCENIRDDGNPCGKCSSCITFETENNPDIHYVTMEKKAKSIGIDDIREKIGKKIEFKSFKYRYKIFIIEKASSMTIQAQNAILKTIEEPPQGCIFILLSENYNRFLTTILSRCVLFKLKPLDYNSVMEYLCRSTDIEKDKAEIFASYAQGNIGRALKLAESEDFIILREKMINTAVMIYNADLTGMYEIVDRLEEFKENIALCFDIIYLFFRDILVYKNFGDIKFIIQKDKINEIKQQAQVYSKKQVIQCLDAITEAMQGLRQNVNFRMNTEIMIFKMKEKNE